MSNQKPDLIAEVENSDAGLAITPAIFEAIELLHSALALEKNRLERLQGEHEDIQHTLDADGDEEAAAIAAMTADRAACLAGECKIIASYLRLFQDRTTAKHPPIVIQ